MYVVENKIGDEYVLKYVEVERNMSIDSMRKDEIQFIRKNYIPKSKIISMLKHYEECEEMYGNLHKNNTYSDGIVIDKICEVLRKLLMEE